MVTPRPRPQVIRLTDAAADRIKYVMANAAKPVVGVRVGVKNGGCAGMTYTMEYAEEVGKADEVVEDKGVRVLIDPKAVLFLLGTEMDYKSDKLSAQFVFNNPNQTSACGCGESVQLKPAAEPLRPASPVAPDDIVELFSVSVRSRCAACSAAPASMPTGRCSPWSRTASSTSRPATAMPPCSSANSLRRSRSRSARASVS